MLEDVKTQKVAIVDANYINDYLHEQGLGQKDEEELQRMVRVYNTRAEPILRRSADKARRREAGEDGIPIDEAVPPFPEVPDTFQPLTDEQRTKIEEFTDAFNHYSRALQYTLTKVAIG
eukprot:2156090-Amphidinium_carterae.1